MTIDGVRGGQPVTAQQMLDAVATEGKAKGLNDEQIAKLQLALQGLIDTKGVEGALLELADGSARIDAGEMNKSLDNASHQMRGDIFAFMALFQQMAQEMRKTARTDRESALQDQMKSLQGAADMMKVAAEKRFTAAIVQGACQIGAGALQVGMAGASTYQSLKSASLTEQSGTASKYAQDTSLDSASRGAMTELASKAKGQADVAASKAQNFGTGAQGAGGIITGAGAIIAGKFEKEASDADAQRMRMEAQAKIHESQHEKATDQLHQAQELIRDIREKVAAQMQSDAETSKGIARNI